MENYDQPFEEENGVEAAPAMADSPVADSHAPETEPVYTSRRSAEGTKKTPFWKKAVAAVLALCIVGGSCACAYQLGTRQSSVRSNRDIDKLNQQVASLQQRLETAASRSDEVVVGTNLSYVGMMTPREIFESNAQSVVGISSTIQATTYGGQLSKGTSTGSGFILTEDGYIVTNHHVIENATAVSVVLSNEEEYEATIVGYDSLNDVAVLKIDAEGLPAVTLGSSDDLCVGDYVVAIGNPLGALTATMTYGIVSGMNRQVTTDSTIINMIQTDAAINSGNSGGPLFNMYGEVVGITTAKYSGTTSSGASIEGIGFAIPIDDVMSIIGDLRDFGYVTGAYLGVTVQNTDESAAALYGLPTGAYVVSVVENGSADRAGIQEKDIIIALGEYEVSNVSELTRTLRRFQAKDQTTITVIRAGERITMDITLDEKPRDLESPTTETQEQMPQSGNYEDWYNYFFGGTPNK